MVLKTTLTALFKDRLHLHFFQKKWNLDQSKYEEYYRAVAGWTLDLTLRHIKCSRVAAHAEDFCVRRHRRRDCCIAAVLLQSMNGGNSGLTHLISCGLLPSSLGTLACSRCTTIQKNDEVNFLTKGPLFPLVLFGSPPSRKKIMMLCHLPM